MKPSASRYERIAVISRLLGIPVPARETLRATLTRKVLSPMGEDEFLRVKLGKVGDRVIATPLQRGAGVLMSMVRADGIVRLPRFSEGEHAGADVQVELLRGLRSLACRMERHSSNALALARALEGHAAVEAMSGRQALEILRAGARVDLVVTDQSMPAMTGVQLTAEVRQLRPALPVLLATGYAERAEVMGSGLPIMAKPFDQPALAKAISGCMGAPAGTGQVVAFRVR